MVSKKGEGVRGVLGDLVSRDRDRREQPQPSAASVEPPLSTPPDADEPRADTPEPAGSVEATLPAATDRLPKKATGIKGRPRVKKDATPQGEKTKVTLSIETELRDQFYMLAHAEMMQPGEYVERALRYYIKTHPKRG